MEIANHLESIVSGLVQDIQSRVSQDLESKINADIEQQIAAKIEQYFLTFDLKAALTSVTGDAISQRVSKYPIDTKQIEEQIKKNQEK